MEFATIITAIGILVALTNIIVEVAKRAARNKIPTNLLVLAVAIVLTLAAGIAYCQVYAVAITWYVIAALVVAGFMVAYAAMFGFDKLKEIMEWGNKEEDNDGEQ